MWNFERHHLRDIVACEPGNAIEEPSRKMGRDASQSIGFIDPAVLRPDDEVMAAKRTLSA